MAEAGRRRESRQPLPRKDVDGRYKGDHDGWGSGSKLIPAPPAPPYPPPRPSPKRGGHPECASDWVRVGTGGGFHKPGLGGFRGTTLAGSRAGNPSPGSKSAVADFDPGEGKRRRGALASPSCSGLSRASMSCGADGGREPTTRGRIARFRERGGVMRLRGSCGKPLSRIEAGCCRLRHARR